jgi:hypothetical protein
MDIEQNLQWLAQCNSGTCRPKRKEEIDSTLPYFNVIKGDMGKYKIEAFNYETHDNAPRMPHVCNWLLNRIFPSVSGDLCGYYNIQLHDNYSYLRDGKDYTDVLCFGKLKDDKGPVQLPDCYFNSSINFMVLGLTRTVPSLSMYAEGQYIDL